MAKRIADGSYLEGAPAVDLSAAGQRERCAVGRGDLYDISGRVAEVAPVDSGGRALVQIQPLIIFLFLFLIVVLVARCVAPKCTVVIDAPSDELRVAGQRNIVQSSGSDLYNTDARSIKEVVQTRGSNIVRPLAVSLARSEA